MYGPFRINVHIRYKVLIEVNSLKDFIRTALVYNWRKGRDFPHNSPAPPTASPRQLPPPERGLRRNWRICESLSPQARRFHRGALSLPHASRVSANAWWCVSITTASYRVALCLVTPCRLPGQLPSVPRLHGFASFRMSYSRSHTLWSLFKLTHFI